MRRPRAALSTISILAATCGLARTAWAARGVDACLDAYEGSQELRRSSHLVEAREKLLVCSRDPCPKALQGDCLVWLGQVENALPSVVLAARDEAGRDVVDVRVTVDGRPLVERLDERAIPLDPGPHVFTFTPAGGAATEARVLLREGEKARAVRVELPAAAEAPRPEPPGVAVAAPVRGAPWTAYALGATGAAALGVFSYFALTGRSDYVDCESGCTVDRRDAIKRDFVAADVALGASLVAIGASIYLFVTNRAPTAPASGRAAVTAEAGARASHVRLTVSF